MTTAVDQVAMEAGGYGAVSEDVMNRLFEIDPIDRPLVDSIGDESAHNVLKEWTGETLEDADPDNAHVDGADNANDDSQLGNRYGNYH